MPKVVERITAIETLQFKLRVWIDVTDIQERANRIHERLNAVRTMFPRFVAGCKSTYEARVKIEEYMLHTNMQNYVAAFEVLDGHGDGFVQYVNWP